jgi:hypothetical protein
MPVFDRACLGLSAAAAVGVLGEAWLHDPIPDEDAELSRRLCSLPRILSPQHLAQLNTRGYCVVQVSTTPPPPVGEAGRSRGGGEISSRFSGDGTNNQSRSSSNQSSSGSGLPLLSLSSVDGARRCASDLVDAHRLEETGNDEVGARHTCTKAHGLVLVAMPVASSQ